MNLVSKMVIGTQGQDHIPGPLCGTVILTLWCSARSTDLTHSTGILHLSRRGSFSDIRELVI